MNNCRNAQQCVYLLHFETGYKHARHYVGMTNDLLRRLKQHGYGWAPSALMAAVNEAGIKWVCARVWLSQGWARERAIKDSRHIPRYCPVCRQGLHNEIDFDEGFGSVLRITESGLLYFEPLSYTKCQRLRQTKPAIGAENLATGTANALVPAMV